MDIIDLPRETLGKSEELEGKKQHPYCSVVHKTCSKGEELRSLSLNSQFMSEMLLSEIA